MNNLLKRVSLLAALVLALNWSASAQITMSNGSVTTCGDVFLDPGGTGNYSNGATIVMTIYPTTPGDGVCLDFTLWDLDYSIFGWSELSFYDGTTTGAPLIMTATGDWETNPGGTAWDFIGPGMVCANGPMTIEWDPDDTGVGWEANISCFTPLGTAGCQLSVNNDTTICSGDAVNLAAVGNVINIPLSNDFNNSTLGTGWSSTVNARFDNPCGPGLDGTPHLWMGIEPAPRTLQSGTYDVSNGGTISFDFRMAVQGDAAPCEGPDLDDEGVYLQYTTNGGTTWTTIHYFFPPFYTDGSSHGTSWQNYIFNIPPAAQTANTAFRWVQNEISSNDTDHWGLDNVEVSFPNSVTISWDQGLGAGTNFTVNPTATTTYTATVTDGVTSCQQSVTVTVNNCGCTPPTVTVITPTAVCAPATIDLSTAFTVGGGGVSTYHSTTGDANTGANPIGATVSTSGTYYIRAEDPLDANCFTIDSVTVTINPAEDAGFSFSAASYCLSGTNPLPTITGDAGGSFTATPAGIVINASTGEIDLSASNAGSYSVTYTTNGPCPDMQSVTVDLDDPSDATFNYDAASYCEDAANPVLTLAGTAGTFSATPAGLNLNASNGAIDLALSTPGTYTVNNDIAVNGACPAVNANVSVTITAVDDPGFAYAGSTFCLGGPNPLPTISGTTGGSFTALPATLPLNGTTGEIDLATAMAGTYAITYTTGGSCPDDSTFNVTLTTAPDATFNYDAATYCENDANPILTLVGSAGTFSATPAGLSINTVTGAIDLSLSTPGTYTVNNDIPASGSCVAVNHNVQLTITALEDPSFGYGTAVFCAGGSNVTATVSGTTGGSFSVTPAGLTVNSTTGEIDLSTAQVGTYDITYTTPGTCADDSTISVSVTTAPDATFNYDTTTYCQSSNAPILTLTGVAGTFSASPAGLTIDPNTGAIDLTSSLAGTYTITNAVGASGGCPAVNFDVVLTVIANPVAPTLGGTTTYCEGDTASGLTASGGGGTINWYDDAGLTNLVGTGGTFDAGQLLVGTHTFYAIETNGLCVGAPASITITVNALPIHNGVSQTTSICEGESVTLVSDGVGTLTWSTGANTDTLVVSPTTSTWYVSTYSNSCGSVSDSVQVTVNPLPTAEAGDSVTIGLGTSTTLNGTGGTSYTWTPPGTLDCSTCADPLATPDATTTYFLTVTDANGCMDVDSVTVIVNTDFDVFLPNVFSPDGDGRNDVFYVRGSGIATLEFVIYDRWGSKMFESSSVDQGWDGTYKGTPVNNGVYVYYVRATGFNSSEPTELKGNVTVLR